MLRISPGHAHRPSYRVAALASAALIVTLAALGLTCSAASDDVTTGGVVGGGGAGGAGGVGGSGSPFAATPDCQAAAAAQTSVGCDYYAVDMDGLFAADNGCFVAFVANTSSNSALLQVSFAGQTLDLSQFVKIPEGAGMSLTYAPYDPTAGLSPGAVAILFLAGHYAMNPNDKPSPTSPVDCPVPAAIPEGAQIHGTGMSAAFHIQTTEPVVAYQMLPYGAGAAAVTGASLLIPTTAWDRTYVAVDAYANASALDTGATPSLSLVASEDDTTVTITPNATIETGVGVPGAAAGTKATYDLSAGQVLQITQGAELTGSPIESSKPVGLWAGHQCSDTPVDVAYCDHDEQQIPAVRALASEYAAASYRQRTSVAENPPWRIIAVANGTELTYDPDVGGPSTVDFGEFVEFSTDTPFVVRSQDAAHPFLLLSYMTGADSVASGSEQGYGDPDVVRVVPPAQYLSRYVFFTDPTYPETNLVVIRGKSFLGFADVTLDCAGPLTGWTPIDSADEYEFTRIDLVRHDFQPQGQCNNGRHEMTSAAPFGLWVWAWGGPESQDGMCLPGSPGYSCYVSYGYPAGEGLATINQVTFPPTQ